jgi:DNA invertase Pin-like site-specific DNA recombinase
VRFGLIDAGVEAIVVDAIQDHSASSVGQGYKETLDRLVHSMRHLLKIVNEVKEKGASLRILGMNLDTDSVTSTMILQVLGAAAEHERLLMLERQRGGIAKAKAEGKYKGVAQGQRWQRPVKSKRCWPRA